jgi:hypothetical protein
MLRVLFEQGKVLVRQGADALGQRVVERLESRVLEVPHEAPACRASEFLSPAGRVIGACVRHQLVELA